MSTIPRQLGKYELQQRIGQGTIGEVWKGRDLQLQRDIAIKILHTDLQQTDPRFFTHFRENGQALITLQHANLVPVTDLNVYRSVETNTLFAYLVMDYIPGMTLHAYLGKTSHRGIFPPVPQIVYLFACIGSALDYAHRRGIAHGNITPRNILLHQQNTTHFEAGEPYVADLGLVRLLNMPINAHTPFYLSPEQARGEAPSARSDIYALGALLYEICTGVQPFRGETPTTVLMQHLHTLPTPPNLINPNIPGALSEVILRAMSKDPASRYPKAAYLAAAIAEACSLRPIYPVTRTGEIEALPAPPTANEGGTLLGVSQPLFRPSTTRTGSTPSLPPLPAAQMPSQTLPVEKAPQQTPPPGSLPAASISMQPTAINPVLKNEPEPTKVVSARTPTTTPAAPQEQLMQQSPVLPPPVPTQEQRTSSLHPVPAHQKQRARTNPLYLIAAVLVVLLLLGGGAASLLFLNRGGQAPASAALVGQVFFQDNALGHNNVIRIQLNNIEAPPDGMGYFAWLQMQDMTQPELPLGQITFKEKQGSLLYPGDKKNTNLLSLSPRGVIITLENADHPPQQPGNREVFRGLFDQAAFPSIKNILYATPGLSEKQSAITSMREALQSINDKAGSIVDSLQNTGDYQLAYRQAVRIIELIDGSTMAHKSGDLPAKQASLLPTETGILTIDNTQGYLDLLSTQITQLKSVASSDQELMKHASNVENAITNLKDWVQKMRTYATQLIKASDIKSPEMIKVALQLKQLAADAYAGRTIPPNQGPQPILGSAGAYQAYVESQYLATLTLQKV
ncbi:serine/threonine protein kinase [Thermosporothrix hazakensis]|jgi:serine/threonine protein kinase|uniref:non-specific serine/threonine protein kinase n=2 Tax=Thermosporothrix TaxID=768650 RepID=A0A326US19_THEHA|nr:serine/threonine-protein kinase [Thermosporothrix hazakensis]PZW36679.1 serine/threonine protein kinase [Thermosporothrix hazakensis]BBH89147.1 hypothetical protein KTC_38980 [Thermosporothrix sp. COM3]GCE47330.1 hypothetical protein KTH_21990 [Thermosporothrix hazakensis]